MFTGLVQDVGTVMLAEHRGRSTRLGIETKLDLSDVKMGESIAVNGACLTVVEHRSGQFEVDVSPETLDKTSAGRLRRGDRVHLERALRLADRLGGHLMLGHVDGVGTLTSRTAEANAWHLAFSAPAEVARYLIDKGCIAVDGVSLTVNRCSASGFGVTIVPHTATETLLAEYPVGTTVNLEADVIGKYVASLLAPVAGGAADENKRLMALLRESGFVKSES